VAVVQEAIPKEELDFLAVLAPAAMEHLAPERGVLELLAKVLLVALLLEHHPKLPLVAVALGKQDKQTQEARVELAETGFNLLLTALQHTEQAAVEAERNQEPAAWPAQAAVVLAQ
jgi:hypothetical protein